MADYVTAQGLVIPTVEDILGELSEEQKATISAFLNTDPDGLLGQINGIFASHLRQAWEVLAIAYNGNNPDTAEGSLLENISAITGTSRAPATRSTFTGSRRLRLTLAASTTVPQGTTFYIPGDPAVQFRTIEPVSSTLAGDYLVSAECLITGPVSCNALTLTGIATPVLGLLSVINDFDASLGTIEDNDTELRIRREQELRAVGSSTVDAIRADLLAITLPDGDKPIKEVIVLNNVTDTIDSNGLEGHSFECIVFDGVTQECPDNTIAQTIWNSQPGGIRVVGSLSGTAIDAEGVSRTVQFSRPVLKEVVLHATLTLTNPLHLASDYLTEIQKSVLLQFEKRVRTGSVIRCNHYEGVIVEIPGIDDAVVQLAFDPPGLFNPPGVNLALGVREIGYIQSSGITVS